MASGGGRADRRPEPPSAAAGSAVTADAPDRLDLSVVVPVFNESQSLVELWPELRRVLDAQPWRAEVIFVDDGSTDGSAAILRDLVARDGRVRLLRLRAN